MSYLALIAAIGAAVASLLYLGRLAGRIIHALELYTQLPARVDQLAARTADNTTALQVLTGEVRRLASVEGGKDPGG